MRPRLLLVSVLLFVGIACGTQSTLPKLEDTPTGPSTLMPTATGTTATTGPARTAGAGDAATPTPSAASAGALLPTKGVAGTPVPKPTPKPTPKRRLLREPVSTTVPDAGILSSAALVRLGPEPPTLDPHLTVDASSALYIVEIYGGLVTIDANLQIVPDLAKAWDMSDGGRTFTFHLREDAEFHDGKTVTAQDFKWSLERVADPSTESPVVDVFLGDVVGVNDKLQGLATSVKGIQAIEDHTLSITIDNPTAFFLAQLTYPTAFVLDRDNVEGNPSWFFEPNGTGPFKLDEYVPGEVLRLKRNEAYHLGPAKLEEVRFILSGGDAMLMFENDEIHVTGVPIISLEGILDESNPLSREILQAPPSFDVTYIGMNTGEPPFDDRKVRQALNYAVDKKTLAHVLLDDLVAPARGILPPGFPGYNPEVKGYEYDPEKARQLLKESKYGDNPKDFPRIVLTLPGSFGASVSPTIEAIIQMWRENLGIEMEILQTEWAIFLQDLHRGRFQMFGGLAWIADYPDPQNFLDVLFHSESSDNQSRYSNQEVDRLLEEARVELDEEVRFEIYHRAEQMILEDAPWIPLWHGDTGFVLLKPNVKDYFLFPMVIPRYRYVYVIED